MGEGQESQENRIVDVSVKDPVCGMAVDPLQPRGKAEHEGRTYFFCSPGCMHKFVSSPAKYLSGHGPFEAPPAAALARKLDKDPVCGMNVDPSKAAASAEYESKLYHFCSRACAEKFKTYPEKYLSPSYKPAGMGPTRQLGARPVESAPGPDGGDKPPFITLADVVSSSAVSAGALFRPPLAKGRESSPSYICPMDPEVRQARPGACPKCGMALESEVPI